MKIFAFSPMSESYGRRQNSRRIIDGQSFTGNVFIWSRCFSRHQTRYLLNQDIRFVTSTRRWNGLFESTLWLT